MIGVCVHLYVPCVRERLEREEARAVEGAVQCRTQVITYLSWFSSRRRVAEKKRHSTQTQPSPDGER